MTTLTKTDAKKLRKRVQAMVDEQCRQRGLEFTLRVSDEIVQQEGWTYFIVTPDKGAVHAYQYAMVLADVETQLRRDDGVENVLIVPALPG